MWTRDRHVLITGASRGIGRALALALADRVARLVLVARNRDGALDRLADELGDRRAVVRTEPLDVRDHAAVATLATSLDRLDVLVLAAGGTHHIGPLDSLSADDVDAVFDTNAKAPVHWLRLLLPVLRRSPGEGPKRAHVVLMGSRSGERALGDLGVYAAAKAAVHHLAAVARVENARHRIVFTVVAPGSVSTSFTDRWPPVAQAAHERESMSVEQAITPILAALDAEFATNVVSYESTMQWLGEPGVRPE